MTTKVEILTSLTPLEECNSTSTEETRSKSELLVSALRVYFSFFACAFTLYCCCRKRFSRLFAVRQWVDEIKNPLAKDQFGYISWVWKVYSFTTEDLLEHVGLDAVCFLRLTKIGFRMAIIGCLNSIWLFPVYLTAPEADEEDDQINRASINILNTGSSRFFAPVLASYLFYGYAFYTILAEFRWFIGQRHIWLQKFNSRNYTIFIRNLPPEFRSNVVLKEHFQLLYGEDTGRYNRSRRSRDFASPSHHGCSIASKRAGSYKVPRGHRKKTPTNDLQSRARPCRIHYQRPPT